MIDWLTARIPYQHHDAIDGGMVFSIDRNGDVDWQTRKRLSVEGSYSSKVQIRTEDQDHLYITGNPSKFLQGHNLFGSNNFVGLANHFFASALSSINLPVTEQNRLDWQNGEYQILRVDIAESFRLPCPADVDTWIRAASQLVKGKHQGVSAYAGETIYVGQKSRRIALKIYNKYKEILKHKLSRDLPMRNELERFSKGLLRVEVRLLSQELKRRNLAIAKEWNESIVEKLLRERIMNLEMPQKMRLNKSELDELPPRLLAVVKLWEQGEDLRNVYPKASFYRYRNDIRKHGIDISSPPPKALDDNVIPLLRVLLAEREPIPAWAVGTPLLACA